MNSQLYTSASGLVLEQRRLELISNNLANISTPGYRAQRMYATPHQPFSDIANASIRSANAGVAVAGSYDVPGRGPVRQTGRELDVALEDGQFLAVQGEGGRRYSRSGNLQVSADGSLVDGGGNVLLNPKGEPIKGLGATTSIAADGRVLEQGVERARLLVVRDPEALLQRTGSTLLTAAGKDEALETVADPQLQPGWLEGSGTNALSELVRLIEAQRAFENYQKLISLTMNEVNRKAVTDIAGR